MYNAPRTLGRPKTGKSLRLTSWRGNDKKATCTSWYARVEGPDAVHDAYISFESALDHATVIDAEQSPEELFTQARALLFGPTHA